MRASPDVLGRVSSEGRSLGLKQRRPKMQNIVILAGNIGQDPETRSTQGGTSITHFTLATSRPRYSEGKVVRDDNGYRVQDTEWHRITAFHAWRDATAGAWPPQYPEERRRAYDLPTIRSWMEVFLYRFFTISQFKRSASPNGPKVTAGGSLSPRGDWRAPSDGNARLWLEELRAHTPSE